MKFRVKYADRIVGLFIVLAAFVLCAGIFFIGANQRWFAKDYRFTTHFKSASGLSVGMPLQMKGFQVGKITRMELNANNLVDVDFVVYDTYYEKAKTNSLIDFVTSPIGLGSQLLFYPGKGDELLTEGSYVPAADSDEGRRIIDNGLVDMPPRDDTITRLIASVGPVLDNVNRAVSSLNRTLTDANLALEGKGGGPLAQILVSTSGTVSNVNGAVTNVNNVVSDVGSRANTVLDKASDIEDSLNSISTNVEQMTAAMRDPTGLATRLIDPKGSIKTILDDQNALYNSILASVTSAQASIKNLQAMTSSLNAEMPTLAATITQTQAAIRQAQDVLEGLKNNPLLRGGIPQQKPQGELYQSIREGDF
jgi:phospholipid/cholesterol/gamma-HCH transport system substrate-binding protein